MSRTTLLVTILAGFILSGCAPMSIKDINADRDGYLKNFTNEQVPLDVKAAIKKADQSGKKFDSLLVEYDVTNTMNSERSDGTKDVSRFVRKIKYVDEGHGIIAMMTEGTKNGLVTYMRTDAYYKNIFFLALQGIPVSGIQAEVPVHVKRITRIDAIPERPESNKNFQMDFAYGSSGFLPSRDGTIRCKSGTYYPASKVWVKLNGDAIDFECEFVNNGIVQVKSVETYLPQYGMVLNRALTTRTTIMLTEITNIEKR